MKVHTLSPTQIHELITLATLVAVEAPPQFKDHAYYTNVRVNTILQLRGKLDDMGVDWRKVMRTHRAENKHSTPADDQIHTRAQIAVRAAATRAFAEREAELRKSAPPYIHEKALGTPERFTKEKP